MTPPGATAGQSAGRRIHGDRLRFVIHKREAWNRPVALTSNLSLEALAEAIGDRSYSRLRSKAVVIEMPPVDFRMLEQD